MREVIRTDTAQRDIDDILAWLDSRSPAAAERLADAIDDLGRLLGGQPRLGRARDDLRPGLRSVVVGRYVLFYRFTDSQVFVMRLIHGSRDITPGLFSGPP